MVAISIIDDKIFAQVQPYVFLVQQLRMSLIGISKRQKGYKDADPEFLLDEDVRKTEKSYSKWSVEENRVYAEFLFENKEEFQVNKDRRSLNFFNKMADQIQLSKTNLQCRSHHQKMMKKYCTVDRIIEAFKATSFLRGLSQNSESHTMSEEQIEFKVSQKSAWTFYSPI